LIGRLLSCAALALMLALALAGGARAQPAPGSALEVALVTMGPGDIYWERFGHNAIVIRDTARDDATVYNFGIFDFESENFLLEFLRGRMMYLAVGEPLKDFERYLRDGRSVDVQWLALLPSQRLALQRHLDEHVAPANARYRYDYYERNCSTKLRDAIDLATGGQLRAALDGPSRGVTYRWHTQRLTAPEPWLYLGTHAGLSGYTDRPITYWQEAFLPMELARRLRDVQVLDGSGNRVSLVAREQRLAQATITLPGETPPNWRLWFLAAGVAVAGLIGVLAATGRRRALMMVSGTLWLFAGLGGASLAALWLLTEHRPAWANENLLLFNPLALALVPIAFVSRWRSGAFARTIAWLVAASAVFALIAKALPGFRQDNLDWILLWLPIHFALALTLAVRRA